MSRDLVRNERSMVEGSGSGVFADTNETLPMQIATAEVNEPVEDLADWGHGMPLLFGDCNQVDASIDVGWDGSIPQWPDLDTLQPCWFDDFDDFDVSVELDVDLFGSGSMMLDQVEETESPQLNLNSTPPHSSADNTPNDPNANSTNTSPPTPPKTIICATCQRTFSKKSALNRHILTAHNDSPARDFQCTVCNKKFSRRDTMHRHMLTHDKSGYHSCCGCGRKFRRDFLRCHLKALGNRACLEAHRRGVMDEVAEVDRSNVGDQVVALDDVGLDIEDDNSTSSSHDDAASLGSQAEGSQIPFTRRVRIRDDGSSESNHPDNLSLTSCMQNDSALPNPDVMIADIDSTDVDESFRVFDEFDWNIPYLASYFVPEFDTWMQASDGYG